MNDFQAAMDHLRRTYVGELGERVATLVDALQRRRDGVAGRWLEQAIEVAHRLRGTAGTLGLSAVATAAGAIEDILLDVASGGPLPDHLAIEALRAAGADAVAALADEPEPG